jgi:hypothetical protein
MANDQIKKGEGDYEAARHYREKTEGFMDSQTTEEIVNNPAHEMSEAEEKEGHEAHEKAKQRAKEFDPEVKRDYSQSKK